MNEICLIAYDVIVIGGGPAGLSAAYSASQNGAKSILMIERDRELGGILQQCIHNGFGLHHFKEDLTGPGYAHRCIKLLDEIEGLTVLTDTMVLDVLPNKTVIANYNRSADIAAQGVWRQESARKPRSHPYTAVRTVADNANEIGYLCSCTNFYSRTRINIIKMTDKYIIF